MSPLMMLHSWGSSSRLLLRRKEPMGVRYFAGSVNRWVATAGVSIRMLRNLGILKILLWRPMRSLQYKAGPREVRRTAIAMLATGINNTSAAGMARAKSNRRLIMA